MRSPIEVALERLIEVFGPQEGLLPSLAHDAVVARLGAELESADVAAAKVSCCRLLELLVSSELPQPTLAVEALRQAHWDDWPERERAAVCSVFDAWWATLLAVHPFNPPVDQTLAVLCQVDVPLIRWLHPMLEALDGPASVHLSEIILGRLDHPSWAGLADEQQQVLAWCRTEPVVMGLTVIGGAHLPSGVFGSVLDELL